jgi:capsular exopolysaccharide synthesis family protein
VTEPSHEHHHAGPSALADFLGLLSRRKWIVLTTTILVVLAVVALSLRQEKLYRARTEVLLNRENLAATLNGSTDYQAFQDPARFSQTQANVARARAVARQTLDAADLPQRSTSSFLDHSSASAQLGSDILTFTATDRNPDLSIRLANEYARQFTLYRRRLDTAPFVQALADVNARLRQLRTSGATNSQLYTTLSDKAQQLQTLETLKTRTATVLNPAERAVQVQPRPLRNGLLGLIAGLVLGLGFAYARDRLDTRVRAADEVGESLGLPLLGRVPEPSRRSSRDKDLVVLTEPNSVQAESFRILRTNVDIANHAVAAKTIMVTSALEKEGKSTITANLAVAFARAGKAVSLVDLDLRRPAVAQLFRIDDSPGVTDVALSGVEMADALRSISVNSSRSHDAVVSANGKLAVLPSGSRSPDPGEFIGTNALSQVLERLRSETDLVLIDAPPLLHVGDSMTLSAKIDAMIVVTRLNVVRRSTLRELQRLLAVSPASKLGFVLAGAEREGAYGYGSYY